MVERTSLLGAGPHRFFDIRALERAGVAALARLPVCLRIVLESLLRNRDGRRIREDDVVALARWQPRAERTREVPFIVARILLQDFTGVPLLVDLAAMRSAGARFGVAPRSVAPLIPVDLVVDHSVQVDFYGRPDAEALNHAVELRRNRPRYEFLKWGAQAFSGLRIVPPGVGICHQVNLELLSRGVVERDGVLAFDTLVGCDSHTTMVNGIGVLGWGVGGIEAEAAMLGEPVSMLEPDVVGVRLDGALPPGSTATDLVLHVTERLRAANVVGKLVEFHGRGVAALGAAERATIANMAPEYGATCGYFPVDEVTLRYYRATGRSEEQVALIREYHEAQGVFGVPAPDAIDYTRVIAIDLAAVGPSVSGPRRPQDRLDLGALGARFRELLVAPPPAGYGIAPDAVGRRARATLGIRAEPAPGGGEQGPDTAPALREASASASTSLHTELEMMNNRPTPDPVPPAPRPPVEVELGHGSVVIAAITSCTNTSNPAVMLAAGLLARNAVARGLRVPAHVKTSLAPGSRAVVEYLGRAGLLAPLEQLGFAVVGYGCTTCIGNSGPLDANIEALVASGLVVASVLSGNRNFEARIHQSVRANYLMSPPLVVAFALAGRVDVDLAREPLGRGADGAPVHLHDIWPGEDELRALVARAASDPELYRRLYAEPVAGPPGWAAIPSRTGELYPWDPASTYVREPPYFEGFALEPPGIAPVRGARALAVFGDSITTDHISPAGAIRPSSPAGRWLAERGVAPADFNTYGARRGDHEVMVRGTFANVRIRNLMLPGEEGGRTVHHPGGERTSIFDAAERYRREGVPLVVFAGRDYGAGSSRDWAAKGPRLLGVRAVVARSFERIHRMNLVGMGVVPLELPEGESAETLGITGAELFSIEGLERPDLRPRDSATLVLERPGGERRTVPLRVRIDGRVELDYVRAGGILPYVLRRIIERQKA